jgi:outer membrane lipase/esterase
MSLKKRVLPALLSSALAFGATGADAVTFNGIYVFGDSLSDSGYFRPFLSAIGLPASQVAVLGRFTTNPGPVWAELIAQSYGGIGTPSNAGGQNYAQGGAKVASDSTSTPPVAATQRPVSTQINEYLAANGGRANPGALYSVWAGANDIFQALPGILGGTINPTTFLAATATAEVQQVARLQAAGAKYILVFNLPDIGNTPQFGGNASVTSLSAGYNVNLFNAIAGSNMRVIPVDTFSLISEVRRNPAAFGFTNVTGTACNLALTQNSSQFCTTATLNAANAQNTYLFADGVHPTTAAHAITADFVRSLIDGPNAYSTMAEVPLATRAGHVRTLDEGLRAGNSAQVGKFTAFAAGDNGKFDISANSLSPATDSKNKSAAVGVTFRVSEAVTLGAALGKSTANATMSGGGKFDTDETVMSAFGSFKSGGAYLNFSGSVADVDFKNVNRTIALGIVTRVNSSSTKGTNVSGSASLGYDYDFGNVSVGPFATITTQTVNVNGFCENSGSTACDPSRAASTDLKIGSQTRNSQVWSVGLRGSIKMGNWTPYARISGEQELRNNDRFISASPVTVTQNIGYDIPGYKSSDKSWMTATLGIRGTLTQQISVGLVYTAINGRSNVKQDGVTGSVAFAF